MPDEPTNWTQATELACPYCSNDRRDLFEPADDGKGGIVCLVCSRTWHPFTRDDKRFLHAGKIDPG